jgi:enterochelin esterase-like enzyme
MLLAAVVLAAVLDSTTGEMLRYQVATPEYHHPHRQVRVYLPASYRRPAAAARRYPVVLMLHGWPGSDKDWVKKGDAPETADSLIAQGRMPDVILVFPDGRGRGRLGRSLYLDSADGKSPVESWLVHDLLAWVDSTFRTIPDPRHRGVIGLSDGGLAAFNLALRHPDVFGAAAAHSASFHLKHPFGVHKLLGDDSTAAVLLEEHSPLIYLIDEVAAARRLTLYFDCGVKDPDLPDNRAMDARLDSLAVPHTYHEFPGGHGWGYWRTHLVTSLETVTAGMRDSTAGP